MPKKQRSAAQKAATKRMIAARNKKPSAKRANRRKEALPARGKYSVTQYVGKRSKNKGRKMIRLKSHFGRRYIRKNPNILGSLKNLISKENLQLAGGVIGAAILNKQVMSMVGSKLPMSDNATVNIAYQAAIPALASVMVRKFAPKIADGLVLGGLVIAVNGLLRQFAPQFAGFGAYVDGSAPYPTLPFPSGQELDPTTGSINSASRLDTSIGYSGVYDSPMPFESNAWSN